MIDTACPAAVHVIRARTPDRAVTPRLRWRCRRRRLECETVARMEHHLVSGQKYIHTRGATPDRDNGGESRTARQRHCGEARGRGWGNEQNGSTVAVLASGEYCLGDR